MLKTLDIKPVQERYQSLLEKLEATDDYEIVSVDAFLPEDRSVFSLC